jgi:hypothetical protein
MSAERANPRSANPQSANPPPTKRPAFTEGWGVLRRGGSVSHWFQKAPRGRIISLCRMARDHTTDVDQTKPRRKCAVCLDIMARSGTFNPVLAKRTVELEERDMITVLKIRLAAEIAQFRADLDRGPRLYVCPTCRQAFEGRTDAPHLCDGSAEAPHTPIRVLELARKDSPPPPPGTR